MNQQTIDHRQASISWRRAVVGVFGLLCLLIGFFQVRFDGTASVMGQSIFLRIGVTLCLLWLAWPTLRRPARWIPPGLLMLAMIALGVGLAQPKFLLMLIPFVGIVLAVGTVLTFLRRLL